MGLIWLVVLLISNAFFVGAEFAVISARRAQIEPKAEAGNTAAKITLRGMERVSLMLATAQLGITVSSLLILLIAEPSIHHLLEVPLHAIGLSDDLVSVVSFSTALILVTYLHVVLGEMLPKNIAIAIPDKSALALTPILFAIATLVSPLVKSLNAVSNLILRAFGFTPRDEADNAYTLEEVEGIVNESAKLGTLEDDSGTILKAFEFTEKTVADVAVPISQLVSLGITATPAELQQAVSDHGFSRYPVINGSSEIIGYWHIKDALAKSEAELDRSLPPKRLRPMISIPQTAELEDALAQMRRSGAHIARSFSASGEIVGCLFLEDIIEELVGEIEDATRR
jgi:CBS domain containing-hemolysin-like protein